MVKIETDIHYIKEAVDGLKQDATQIKKSQEDFIKMADERYASKIAEKIVYALVGTILTVIVLAVLRLVVI